jgi:CheY-like chemotaxis protein
MYSRTQSEQDDETDCHLVSYNLRIKRLDFRSALVIEKSDVFRRSIVQHLKNRGWIVHGITGAEQAFPILKHIPYHLILVESELSGMTAIEFARIIHESGKGQGSQLVVITGSPGRSSATELTACGAFLAKRPTWKDDVSTLLANLESHAKIFDQYLLSDSQKR